MKIKYVYMWHSIELSIFIQHKCCMPLIHILWVIYMKYASSGFCVSQGIYHFLPSSLRYKIDNSNICRKLWGVEEKFLEPTKFQERRTFISLYLVMERQIIYNK